MTQKVGQEAHKTLRLSLSNHQQDPSLKALWILQGSYKAAKECQTHTSWQLIAVVCFLRTSYQVRCQVSRSLLFRVSIASLVNVYSELTLILLSLAAELIKGSRLNSNLFANLTALKILRGSSKNV